KDRALVIQIDDDARKSVSFAENQTIARDPLFAQSRTQFPCVLHPVLDPAIVDLGVRREDAHSDGRFRVPQTYGAEGPAPYSHPASRRSREFSDVIAVDPRMSRGK